LIESGGSLHITLPPAWLKDRGLRQGDLVAIFIEGRKLVIMPKEGF
jgi:antitoxin component of MazEF toxin-antitoxin module